MKSLLIMSIALGLITCNQAAEPEKLQEATKDELAVEEVTPIQILGKTIEYRYGESVYHVMVDTDSTMHWEAMAGDEKGVKAHENYKMDYLDTQTIFISWGEANGIGVSQVLDFRNGKVYNHLLRDREISLGVGQIRLLE